LTGGFEKFSREALEDVAEAKCCEPAITSAPGSCFDSSGRAIAGETKRRRLHGSAMDRAADRASRYDPVAALAVLVLART